MIRDIVSSLSGDREYTGYTSDRHSGAYESRISITRSKCENKLIAISAGSRLADIDSVFQEISSVHRNTSSNTRRHSSKRNNIRGIKCIYRSSNNRRERELVRDIIRNYTISTTSIIEHLYLFRIECTIP